MADRSDSSRALVSAQPAAWTERGIEPVGSADRLTSDQPESGLLWVVDGAVAVERNGRRHEITRGSVAAYRLGGGLAWSAGDGTHVRWSARSVRLEPGQVTPWTADLALDIPPSGATTERPHRRMFAVMAIALSWAVALTVAWCYDQAHGSRLTGAAHSIPRMTEDDSAVATEAVSAFENAGMRKAGDPFFPKGKSSKLNLRVFVDRSESTWDRENGVVQRIFESHAGLSGIVLRLMDVRGNQWMLLKYSRDAAVPLEVPGEEPGASVAVPAAGSREGGTRPQPATALR